MVRMIAANSSVFGSGSAATLLAPACGDARLNSASRREFADHSSGNRLAGFHHIPQKLVHHVLVKNAKVPVFELIHLQRFELQAKLIRNVAERQLSEIRQAGL